MTQTTRSLITGEARVLVLLDDPLVAELVRLTLNHGVFVIRVARDTAAALTTLEEWRPHLAILDMDLAGHELLRQMGGDSGTVTHIPVVGLTRRGDLKSKLDAFEQGVDDIMTMPFSPEELLARVIVITRRTYGEHLLLRPAVQVGDLELDILHRRVTVGGHELHLTGMEQSLLYLLAGNAGRIITRDEILDTLWGSDFISASNIVDRHVRNLRAKLQNDYRKPRFIATVPGHGYRFIPTAVDPDDHS
jgi:DNA-binding response OmpR family regulator